MLLIFLILQTAKAEAPLLLAVLHHASLANLEERPRAWDDLLTGDFFARNPLNRYIHQLQRQILRQLLESSGIGLRAGRLP